MKKEQSFEARVQLTARMQQGQSWIASAAATGLHVSQSTAYRLLQGYRMQGSAALTRVAGRRRESLVARLLRSLLYRKRCQLTKERADTLSRVLGNHQMELERQGMDRWRVRQTIREEKAAADAEIEE